MPADLRLIGEGMDGAPPPVPVPPTIELYGPGDVVGIDPRAPQ